jgi:hypothetical protein
VANWSQVAAGFKNLLERVPGIGKVHPFIVYSDQAATSPAWRDLFTKNGKVNFVSFTKLGSSESEVQLEDSRCTRYTETVEFQVWVAAQSDANEQWAAIELFDRIVKQFNVVDRTLNGLVNSFSLPEIVDAPPTASFGNVACQALIFRVKYDYYSYKTIDLEVMAPETNTGQHVEAEKIGLALIEAIKAQVVPEIVPSNDRVILAPSIQSINGAGEYPCDPRNTLPKIELYIDSFKTSPKMVSGGLQSNFELNGTFTVYLLQTPGQDHQTRMLRALQHLNKTLLGVFRSPFVASIDGFSSDSIIPAPSTIVGQLESPLGDPSLTVSVGTYPVMVSGKVTTR